MKRSTTLVAASAVLLVLLAGCNFPGFQESRQDPVATSAAATIEASLELTRMAAIVAPPTLPPTIVIPPTEPAVTPTPAPPTAVPATNTPSTPCNAAAFVSDVTYPDDTSVVVNTDFTKTWRLKNVGTCTWTSGYKLVFDSGDRMSAPDSQTLTSGSVAPGATIDVSVDLKAPGSSGTYQGNFKLRESGGVLFGIGASASGPFWVRIKAATAESLEPDLVVSSITLDPAIPTQGESVEVRVKFKNEGGSVAEDFTVAWWPGKNYPSPACTWDINDLDAGDDQTRNCTYAGYPSWYPSIETKAEVDTDDDVDESDEGNNIRLKTIEVEAP